MPARSRSSRPAPPAAASRHRAAAGLALAALLGFAGGAAAWWFARPSAPPSERSAPHPAAAAGLAEANARAVSLVTAGRAHESLPWFRRQFELMTEHVWAAHKDFASALHNAAAESGPDGPATRSSIERMALLRESLDQLDVAASLTERPAERAALLADRAHTLEFWGMPWDALEALERAAALPGAAPDLAARARFARSQLERPAGGAAARGRG